jgi:GNAT superfamily N-acetyltransferase
MPALQREREREREREYEHEYEHESRRPQPSTGDVLLKIDRLETRESIEEAFDLVKRVFDQFVAPDFSQEGVREFFSLVTPEFLTSLPASGGFALGALEGNTLVGMIAVRNMNHIALFFVERAYQKKGIGRKLFLEAARMVRAQGADSIDVHSSPFAVPCYKALGFSATSSELVEKGIRYTPMRVDFAAKHAV